MIMEGVRGLLQRQSRAVPSMARVSRPLQHQHQHQQVYCPLLHSRSRGISSSSSLIGTRRGRCVMAGKDGRVTVPALWGPGSTARFSSSGGGAGGEARIAQGEDVELVRAGMEGLVGRGWELDAAGMGIQKTFYFRTYFKAVSFVNVIASQSAVKKHHPTMTVRIGSVDVHWTTHHPQGLTQKDIAMAQHCEEGAELLGSVQQTQGKKCAPPPTASLGTPSTSPS